MFRDIWFWLFVVALVSAWLFGSAWNWRRVTKHPQRLPAYDSLQIIELQLAVRRLYYLIVWGHESGQPKAQTIRDAKQLLDGTDFQIQEFE